MYIKSIVIDGFKSYAHRTGIDGFDPQFNAITGLNGSGKSNILDSICFVLGIKNLSHVRANNLQDLVYKSGQAGVTKATVSITFDNSDKAHCPVGYEHYEEITITRQVVIGGRNKYLINGTNAQNTRVEDLFRSVQMNVNNPHFIIMQGRITKVLNMKPAEILSMIEEAAGTKMYESKKQAALKTIEKKDAKLREIDKMLNEEITPTLEKLKQERSAYLEYQKVQREIEHLSQLVVAYDYLKSSEVKLKTRQAVGEAENNISVCQRRLETNEKRAAEIQIEIEQLEKARDEQSGKELASLEEEVKESRNGEAIVVSSFENKKETLKGEEKRRKDLIKNIDGSKKLLTVKRKEADDLQNNAGGMLEKAKKDREELEAAQKCLQNLAVGLSVNEKGENETLAHQLIVAKEEISRKQTEIAQTEMKLKHLRVELKKNQAQVRKSAGDSNVERDQAKLATLEQEIADLESNLAKLNVDDEAEQRLTSERREINQEMIRLQEKIESVQSRLPQQINFEYKDPSASFDRSKVKGVVVKLIHVKDINTSTAIEVAAGDRLYNVVVDDEETGKLILKKGELKKRVTFIPLSKIDAQPIQAAVVNKAKALVGKENCDLALSLVGFDGNVRKAVEYVFGNTLVCNDMDSAKRVTFNKDVAKRSVTLDGEVFDPQGTLSGGARQQGASVLRVLSETQTTSVELEQRKSLRDECDKKMAALADRLEQRRRLNQTCELKRREANHTRDKLQQTTSHRVAQDIQRLQREIAEAEKILSDDAESLKKCERKASELEERMKNADAYREAEMKSAEKRLTDAKKNVQMSDTKSKENQQTADSLKLEIVEIENELTNYEVQLKTSDEAIEQLKGQIDRISETVEEAKKLLKDAEQRVSRQKEILRARSKEITAKQNEKESLVKDGRKVELKMKQFHQEIERLNAEHKDASKKVEQMKASYPWIGQQEQFFGKHGTAFDFTNVDIVESTRRLQTLQENKEKMARNINTRAMNMFNQAEEQYKDLIKKKRIVEMDKEKIETVIKELDEKKNEALEKAWDQVNKDFGSIFSMLLPGTKAKLEPPAGMTVLDGLEVRVAFGDVWKESLAELSGGQRSLIALSLVLAMLLFKPAPIYILDEVDAALDVSHTQNIGRMLKSHFKYSQFIVVSLKEGMFANANVLFRTKFVDGQSTVVRHVQQRRRSAPNDQDNNETAALALRNQPNLNNKKQKKC